MFNLKTISLTAILVFISVLLLIGFIVQILWNDFLVTAIDGFHPIDYAQALAITVLCNILFKSSNS